mgnify:CR=1 FL=1
MSPKQLKVINHKVIDIVSKNIIDQNDKYVLKKLLKIDTYLEIQLGLNQNTSYSDLLNGIEFSEYISELWKPASFMGWYNLNLSVEEKKIFDEYQTIIRQVSRSTIR